MTWRALFCKSPGTRLPVGLELLIHLADEPLAGHAGFLDLRIEIGGDLRRDDLVLALALIDETRNAIANGQRHVAVGDHRSAIDRRPVARNDLRVRTGVTDHDAETINQPLQRSAVGAIDVRVLNRSIEVA